MIAYRTPKYDLATPGGTTKIISGAEYAEQRIRISLEFFLGEWFLNTRLGIPYYRDILTKAPNEATVRSVIRRAILTTSGIVSAKVTRYELDTKNRVMSLGWEAEYNDGTVIRRSQDLDLS